MGEGIAIGVAVPYSPRIAGHIRTLQIVEGGRNEGSLHAVTYPAELGFVEC